MASFCIYCGGKGKVGGCKHCGKELQNKIDYEDEKFLKHVESSEIPNGYVGVKWSKEKFINSHQNVVSDPKFIKFAESLNALHGVFQEGKMPRKSAIIIAPRRYSKITFAYSCMQYAISSKLTVAPLLDTKELKRLLYLMGDKIYKLKNGMTVDDYVDCDICFVTVSKLPCRRESFDVIVELLNMRSRRGLPTFIMSEFSLEEMAMYCDTDVDTIKDFSGVENNFKYPAIESYNPDFNLI